MKKSIITALLLFFVAVLAHAQQITVHGTVISASDSEPLIGASVVSKAGAAGQGAATDIDGNFTITVPAGTDLLVSYIGYKSKTVKAAPEMTIALDEDSELLEEVVVVGYSTQKK